MPRGSCVTPGASKAAAIERKIVDRFLVDDGGNSAGNSLHQRRRTRDRHGLAGPCHGQAELQFDRAAHIDVNLGRDLRGYALDLSARGVISRRSSSTTKRPSSSDIAERRVPVHVAATTTVADATGRRRDPGRCRAWRPWRRLAQPR